MNPLDHSGADYVRTLCGLCEDFRRVDAPPGLIAASGEPIRTVPCPSCGTDEQRREKFIQSNRLPALRISDLTEDEMATFRQWRGAGHHELDCLRWIEGGRYKPEEDKEFLKECFFKLAEWREARDKAWEKRGNR
jgi:hypothetical protein